MAATISKVRAPLALACRGLDEPGQQLGRPGPLDLLDEFAPGSHVPRVESPEGRAPLFGRLVDPRIAIARRTVLVCAEQLDQAIPLLLELTEACPQPIERRLHPRLQLLPQLVIQRRLEHPVGRRRHGGPRVLAKARRIHRLRRLAEAAGRRGGGFSQDERTEGDLAQLEKVRLEEIGLEPRTAGELSRHVRGGASRDFVQRPGGHGELGQLRGRGGRDLLAAEQLQGGPRRRTGRGLSSARRRQRDDLLGEQVAKQKPIVSPRQLQALAPYFARPGQLTLHAVDRPLEGVLLSP